MDAFILECIIYLLLAFLIWIIIKNIMEFRPGGSGGTIGGRDDGTSDEGDIPDSNKDSANNKFTFHPRCGPNIAILQDGRTVKKISIAEPIKAVVFTSRPLKDNEIFEMRLDERINKTGHSMGIGIITSTPENVEILQEMWRSPVAWIWHHTCIHNSNKAILVNYPKKNMNELQAGDKVGVMRNEFGTIHFYINGVDQGPAVSGIPSPVYGLFELWQDAVKATIVNPK